MRENILLYSFLMLMLLEQEDFEIYQIEIRKKHIIFSMHTKVQGMRGKQTQEKPSECK